MIFFVLILMNLLAEYLLNRMMLTMNILEKENNIYHVLCAVLRVLWICLCAWFSSPLPIVLIGLFILLFLNILPYYKRSLLMTNFTMIIFLIYTSLLMMIIGFVGLIGFNAVQLKQNAVMRVIIINMSFLIFNLICFLLLRFYPEFLWKEDYDRLKVVIYTRFLIVCCIYHIFDAAILTMYDVGWVNYLLLVLGDALILILMFNFLNYNFVFAKSEAMKKEYVENEIILAQQFFEKESLKQLSEFDSLTNAYNRREISSIMLENINIGNKIVCVFVDLDGLKRTNDRYGHTFGDLMLKKFADASIEIMRENGYLARIGGDEFLLIFINQQIEDVDSRMEELQLKLLEPTDEKQKIYFSYGISYNEKSVEDYINSADQRMYVCKNRKWRDAP